MRQDIVFYFSLCILIRFLIAYICYYSVNYKLLQYSIIIILFTISLGFLYQYISKIRNIGAFNQKIWWDFMRPIHFFFYLYASYLLYNNKNYESFIIICFDTIVGLLSFIINHYSISF